MSLFKKTLILILQLVLFSGVAFSDSKVLSEFDLFEINQQESRVITGEVVTDYGESLPGVTVVIPGTSIGTITDTEGKFTLRVPSNTNFLHFSFIGMIAQDVDISSVESITVTLTEDTIGLEEVVAIGYGSLAKNRVSTSIESIAPDEIRDQLTNSVDNALEGKIAGVSIRQGSGAPGGGSTIQIRGSGSIGASTEPLIVVDGIPLQSSFSKERSPLAMIDQADIESIEILKDVSATAVYGSRGSNGVILITTKSGKAGRSEISFDSRIGFQQAMKRGKMDLMNAEEFARWRLENAQDYAKFYGTQFNIEDVAEEYRNPEFWRGKGTDWQDVMTRIAPMQSYNLSVSHGTDKFTGYFSFGYTHDEGAVVETNFKRLNFRANMDYKPLEFLQIGLQLNPTIRKWGNQVGGHRESAWGNAVVAPPLDGPYFDDVPNEQEKYFDGEYDLNIQSSGTFNFTNSLYDLKNQVSNDESFDLYVQPYLQITPLKDLTLRSQLTLQWSHNFNEYFKPSTVNTGWSLPPLETTGSYNTGKTYNWLFENTLAYDKTIDKHSFTALIGHTMESYNYYNSWLNGNQYPSDEIKTLNAAQQYSGGTSESNWTMISNIFRLSYDYDIKYLTTLTLRRDGSSRFGPDSRWGIFPSASVGWNVSKEDFFPKTDWLTNLKLRASVGTSGNNRIGDYTWQSLLNNNNYSFGEQIASGKVPAGLENRKLTWEKSTEYTAGLELTLWRGRLNFVTDFYNKTTEDMLWQVPVPISSGFHSYMQNIGKIENRGVEFSINSINITNKDFTWSSDFNISFNRNKVLNLGPLDDIKTYVGYEGQWQITQIGQPMAMFYGWKKLGILNDWDDVENNAIVPGQLPGTPHWYDADKNGMIDERDRIIIGNPHPKFRGGLHNSLRYKNWDLGISTSFAYDFDVYAGLQATLINLDGVFNVLKDVKDRWRSPENPGNGWISSSFHQTHLDREGNSDFVHNVSFLKVQNINLGYTFNKLNEIEYLRLSLSFQNPFMFTNYKYGNPEVNLYGNSATMLNYHRYDYPLTQSVAFGLNITL